MANVLPSIAWCWRWGIIHPRIRAAFRPIFSRRHTTFAIRGSAGPRMSLPSTAPVLLIGTGLTTLDVALDLHARGIPGVIAVSRAGSCRARTIPRCRRPKRPTARQIWMGFRPQLAMCAVRRHIRSLRANGNWRQVIDSLRPITPALWRRLETRERERFMRHLRPFWEVHRHRASPETGAAIDRLRQSGWLQVMAGRLLDAKVSDGQAIVTVAERGTGLRREFRAGAVLNCTGPATDVRRAGDPLLDCALPLGPGATRSAGPRHRRGRRRRDH